MASLRRSPLRHITLSMLFHNEFEEVGGVAGDDFDEVGGGGESGDVEAVGTPEVQQCLSERRRDWV